MLVAFSWGVVRHLARRGFSAVSLDLFRIATAAERAEALVTASISNRTALRRAVHQTRRRVHGGGHEPSRLR